MSNVAKIGLKRILGRQGVITSSRDEGISLLALASIKGVGFHTLWGYAESGGSFAELLGASDKAEVFAALHSKGARLDPSSTAPWSSVRQSLLERAESVLAEFARRRISILFRSDPRFPSALFGLPDAPHWLFVEGAAPVLNQPSISIVGTREPSHWGLWLADFVGLNLGEWNAPTVSGLALGIDQSIHLASLTSGIPTVAVLGTGILSDYPKNSREIREAIVEAGGAVVTEYLPNETYNAANFVKRNRIQAALGRVLIPVEWRERSGTAHTVRFAAGLRRPIAGLRLASWNADQVALPLSAGDLGKVFTIPGEESAFRSFVGRALKTPFYFSEHSNPTLFDVAP